jgi:electron transfer flavoprotein alpha subunit
MTKILIIADQQNNEVKKSTYNVISGAQDLGRRLGASYDIVVVGGSVAGQAEGLRAYGAGTVFTISGVDFQHYLAQPYANAIKELAVRTGATHICGSASSTGKDMLPRIAAGLGAGMVAECSGFDGEGGGLLYHRPMYAGNIVASVKVNTENAVVSFRTSEFDAAEAGDGQSAVEALDAPSIESNARFISFDGAESERPDLGEADVVVAGGRGLKDGENFYAVLEPLADALGAAIGASRAAVDSGFCPNDLQIGQTGKVVAPNLYFAIALSGAIQHLAGMKNSKTIVAINKDPDAPIFQVADYGLVADAFSAVPELVQKIKQSQ